MTWFLSLETLRVKTFVVVKAGLQIQNKVKKVFLKFFVCFLSFYLYFIHLYYLLEQNMFWEGRIPSNKLIIMSIYIITYQYQESIQNPVWCFLSLIWVHSLVC